MAKISTADCLKEIEGNFSFKVPEYSADQLVGSKWKRLHKSGENPITRIFFNDKFPIKAVVTESNNAIVGVQFSAATEWDMRNYVKDDGEMSSMLDDQLESTEYRSLLERTITGDLFCFDVRGEEDEEIFFMISPIDYSRYDQHLQSYIEHLDPDLLNDEVEEATFVSAYDKDETIRRLESVGMKKEDF